MEGKVTKIYELKTLGFSELNKELTTITSKFEQIKRAKLSAQGKLIASQDIADVQKYATEVNKLAIEEQRYRTEVQRLSSEIKAQQLVRQQDINLKKQAQQQNNAEAGSIVALRKEIKELNTAIINRAQGNDVNFRGQILQYDAAIKKLQELTTAEQNYRRQFAQDRLLVGEYTSGIVQAFKKMGLDDLIGGQITRASQRINDLDKDFDKIKQDLSQLGVSGEGNLQKLEKELIDNRKEALALQQQVAGLQKELRGTGDVGNQITASIKRGFQDLRGQVASFVIGYLGFQALFSKITTEVSEGINDAKQIEGVTAAFNRLNDPNLLNRLREATRGTVSDLKLMQITVQATNFQIPQEQLGELLDFARRRAKETGQSVDFLVDSIVTGIGRKSPLILDNLGISAVRLREKLKGVAEENANVGDVAEAVAQIIREENAKAGIEIDTLGERIQQNEASWRNLRLEFAANLLPALVTIGTVFLGLITNLPLLTGIIAVLAAGWAVTNAQLVINNAQLILYNLLILRNYVLIGLLSTVQLAYNASLFVFNGVLRLATAGLRLFGITAATASGPLGVILTLVGLVGIALIGLSKSLANNVQELEKNNLKLKILADTQREAAAATVEQRTKAELLVKVVKDLTISEETRNRALKDLIALDPIFQKALVDGKVNYEKLNDALKEYNKSLIENATIQAAQNRVNKERAELERLIGLRQSLEQRRAGIGSRNFGDLTEEEQQLFVNDRIFSLKGFQGTANLLNLRVSDTEFKKAIANVNKLIASQTKVAEVTGDAFAGLLTDKLRKEGNTSPALSVFQRFSQLLKGGTEPEFKKLLEDIDKEKEKYSVFSSEYKKLQQLRTQVESILNPKNKPGTASSLTGAQKDAFKDIDAIRDQQLAVEKQKRLQNQTDEETYLKNILAINVKAIDDKLKLIKGANAEERKQIAELKLQKITEEQETNKRIFDLRISTLKSQLQQEILIANQQAETVENNPNTTETERAQARLNADNRILQLQEQFAKDLDVLENQLGQQSINNETETANEILKTKQQLKDDELKLAAARIRDIQTNSSKEISQINIDFGKVREAILKNDRLTNQQRQIQLDNLQRLQNFTILSAELKRLTREFEEIDKQYKKGLVNEEAYLKAKQALQDKYNEQQQARAGLSRRNLPIPSGAGTQSAVVDRLSSALGFAEGSAEEQLLGEVIGRSFQFAQSAMNEYFDAEEARIRRSLDLQFERLDREKELLINRAQSRAEEESIEKQFLARKRKAEREAGEELKKQRRAEAKISLAAELANIAVAAAGNPANAFTFGAAGVIMYGALAALALGRYALRVNEINRQQFEFGGVPKRGGEIGGRPHTEGGTPFQYEAEKGELSIIRTKDAPRNKVFQVMGTQRQIASAMNVAGGGHNFEPGAKIKRFAFGGNLGEVLQPPTLPPNFGINTVAFSGGISEEKFDEMMNKLDQKTDAINNRIDRLQVIQNTNTVTEAQTKIAKQTSVGTL